MYFVDFVYFVVTRSGVNPATRNGLKPWGDAGIKPVWTRVGTPMTCREFADFIAGYESGELGEPSRASFDRHLSGCVNCRRYLEHYRATVALGKTAFDDENAAVPADVPEDLVAAILAARTQKPV